MAKLWQGKDGSNYTRVRYYGQIATLQIHPEGVNFLLEHDVFPGMEIPDVYRRHLSNQRWFYTKGENPASVMQLEEINFDDPIEVDPDLLADEAEFGSDDLQEAIDADPADVDSVGPHANRPLFLFDASSNVHYTVLHLYGNDRSDPTVMCIKWRAAEWLKDQGLSVGRELPDGAFSVMFSNRWFYPNPGWTPPEARPLVLNDLPVQPKLEPANVADMSLGSNVAGMIGCLIVFAIVIYLLYRFA